MVRGELSQRSNLEPTEEFLEQIPLLIYGKVLEGGLGLGKASEKILKNKAVKKLDTIEIDKSVINNYKIKDKKRHKIIKQDFYKKLKKLKKREYDFIFDGINERVILDDHNKV